ncbi:aminomethyl-transferring glycine dehydrogenase [Intrasporangium sp.]|uniref:aminomethyl-transferring glycine dehydrogenase n=1 Tax=Intrasporangium sp. TaxID=1925024 RepID=UPI00293970CF|nr:aminomethyl-transferring glycine dehydrogenase [Intrasporangium sp.]MDV3221275.1 aminomethyl-transferring glycine dehydrogenase [Intrasporangium sp.]
MSSQSQSTLARPFADFVARHVGPDADAVQEMLQVVGQPSLDAMCDRAIPGAIRSTEALNLEAAESETAVIEELRGFASRNRVLTSLIGLGYYGTITPPVVRRNVLENPAWYTAYTPYQPEISQGRLEALLNFQTVVSDLTGLEIAGSSLLDEGTAAAEAMSLMHRASRASDGVVVVDERVFPQTIAVMQTRASAIGLPLVVTDLRDVRTPEQLTATAGGATVVGVVVQYPDATGEVIDWRALTEAVHSAGGLVTACADLLALALFAAPGEWGADIAVGSAQRLGVPMGFGGPHAGYMSVHKGLERQLPGRLVGVSVDSHGKPAYRLALQTREQHIRREKATSNICTAQVLLAVMASMYAVWHGPDGLTRIARRIQAHTATLRAALLAAGVDVTTRTHFDTLTISVPGRADEVVQGFLDRGINILRLDADRVSLSLDETTTAKTVAAVLETFGLRAVTGADDATSDDRESSYAAGEPGDIIAPDGLARTSDFLTHPVFHAHRSETAMLRYLRRLADRDFALDRGMIPLGSCTMKLNATTEMESITWPEFADLHPFAPVDQSEGIRTLIDQLAQWLCDITGYDAVSLQPNAGSQGEFSGLLAIHAYHQARGEGHRRICLIPASAHGTNAASAVMAGLQVVVVKTADDGTVDLDDLRTKVDEHRDDLAAIMVTYPSTHGVYEDTITELCGLVHDAGGQVYVDGANLNALVGLAQPGKFGADVSHLNLHKTFCIPHGGGGPGVGPVAVRAHLAPHLPNHPFAPEAGPETGVGPVSAAPYGSASILPISWAYVRLMGGAGLRHATQLAVLNANYIAARLREHYPVLYSGHDGLVAHECILDVRRITAETGVTVDDIAKRLVDYGFHAPTMSFPVAGTLMVEPTESENKYELDRFCDAMIAIRAEIEAIHKGDVALTDSMLRHAPHTAQAIASGDWPHGYERADAAFPVGVDASDKYWPPVGRIDGAYGDRHLVCSCPPPEAFEG